MNINIPDEIIREFLGGVSAVVAVIATGAILFFLSRRIARKLPFTRMGLVLALAPLSLINFLGNSEILDSRAGNLPRSYSRLPASVDAWFQR